ncbi:hypothetical protein BJ508DRAFT_335643, partial [Ascobolus immersus RN42]
MARAGQDDGAAKTFSRSDLTPLNTATKRRIASFETEAEFKDRMSAHLDMSPPFTQLSPSDVHNKRHRGNDRQNSGIQKLSDVAPKGPLRRAIETAPEPFSTQESVQSTGSKLARDDTPRPQPADNIRGDRQYRDLDPRQHAPPVYRSYQNFAPAPPKSAAPHREAHPPQDFRTGPAQNQKSVAPPQPYLQANLSPPAQPQFHLEAHPQPRPQPEPHVEVPLQHRTSRRNG